MKETDPELLMHLKKINLLSNEEILDDKAK